MSFSEILNAIETSFVASISSYQNFIENIQFSELLKLDNRLLKSIFSVFSVIDSLRFNAEKKLDTLVVVYENISPDLGTSISDTFSIADEFSKSIFIGIIDNEGLAETLVKDFGLSVLEALNVSATLKERGEVEPLKRKTYLFTKGNKIYLFRDVKK